MEPSTGKSSVSDLLIHITNKRTIKARRVMREVGARDGAEPSDSAKVPLFLSVGKEMKNMI